MPKDYIRKIQNVSRVIERSPHRAAIIAVNFSKERFRQKNWVDTSRQSWQKRKNPRGRGSLMNSTGRLKRSIRKVRVTKDYILIGTDVPYAEIHNEGGKINKTVTVRQHTRKNTRGRGGRSNVKSHSRKMNLTIPQRQFIGASGVLLRRVERMIEKELKKAIE